MPPIVGRRWGRQGVNYVAIDYDADNETVFFSDVRNRVIYKGTIGQSGKDVYLKLLKWILSMHQINVGVNFSKHSLLPMYIH